MEVLKAPKDKIANQRYRIFIAQKAEGDPDFQQILKAKCAKDAIFFIDTFCYTRNPRLPEIPNIPFILYGYQEKYLIEIIDCILRGEDVLIEKTRDMGASWLVLLAYLWCFMFHDGADFKVGSWKQEFVDLLDSMDSLMEKYRFVLKRMPAWLRGNINPNFPFMRVTCEDNGNTILGETASPNFGSGGRRKSCFMDEFAKWDNSAADGAHTSTADVTNCRIYNSTPFGSGNKYAFLANESNIRKITMHWTLHPEKNKECYYIDLVTGQHLPIDTSDGGWRAFEIWKKYRGEILPASMGLRGGVVRSEWYDKECIRRDNDQDIAQELDIDYKRSGAPFFDMVALNAQREWTWIEIPRGSKEIPYGRYITGDLVMVENKVHFRQKEEIRGGWMRVFEFPEKGVRYANGADTCEGLPKGDGNAFVMRDSIDRNVVATIGNQNRPEDFAYQVWLAHKWYFEAWTAPENNNHGYTLCKELDDLGTNLYYTKRYEGKSGDENTTKRGFSTTPKTRPMMLDKGASEVSKKSNEIRDGRIINQMKVFVRPENKPNHPEADGNFKDDFVLAYCISSVAISEMPNKKTRLDEDTRKKALKDDIIKKRKIKIRR